jgi:hypothetical protein
MDEETFMRDVIQALIDRVSVSEPTATIVASLRLAQDAIGLMTLGDWLELPFDEAAKASSSVENNAWLMIKGLALQIMKAGS